ncbi:heavy metal translocating P-type ATPase [Vreelandella subglaciescola]|uniref:P-type Zn(2+) transporter n=1 Tax=Vreelandella subglaciescola TaxID=29571 RepID=A0A1M7H6C9_9GAMM|nr:heavy metal translocating P-type ATPase [Halomonas subglaciescola]SHM23948.1 Cd2+/Zn2+-exporting ATPase [Halomonas subglaciescola]
MTLSANNTAHPSFQRLRVSGMDCAGCERKAVAAATRVAGVAHAEANAAAGTLDITPEPNVTPSPEAIEQAMRGLGYAVVSKPAAGEAVDEPAWWQSAKGKLVLASGALLALAAVLHLAWPALGSWPFVAATLVGLYPIVQAAWQALRVGEVFTIEALMSIAAVGALIIGAAAESAVVVVLFAVGELLEGVASSRARRSISALSDLTPSTAWRLASVGEAPEEVPADSLAPGQRVLVRPGDRLPCDGRIEQGGSYIDESPVNGEAEPRYKRGGDDVFAGTVNQDGALTVEVTRRADDNTIARIIRLVEDAQAAKAPVARFIDRFARWYMPVVVALALLLAVVPPLVSGMAWSESIYRALALLLIACPCALVISTPAAIAAGLSSGARRGLLIKGGAVLESLGKLKVVALDKTGTLTAGAPEVTDIEAWHGVERAEVLSLAGALERESGHPIAAAIVAYANAAREKPQLPAVEDGRAIAGAGVSGRIGGVEVTLASPRYAAGVATLDEVANARINALEEEGKSISVLLKDGVAVGAIALRDEPREDARKGLDALSKLGVKAVMLSGDNARSAAAIGKMLGIEAHGELMPEDKAGYVSRWQQEGRGPVGKVGDGINDAPALAAADVGIAMGGGTDVALETADAALLKNRVAGIAELIQLSRATLANVKTNVALALGFKAIFLVTTALGITGLWIAVMADTGATVLVTLNAMRLLRHKF